MGFTPVFFICVGLLSGIYILYEDIKYQKIPLFVLVLLCCSLLGGFYYFTLSLNYLSACFLSLLFFLFWKLKKAGSADVILVGILGLMIPPILLPLFLFVSGILGLMYFLFIEKDATRFPLAPTLLLSCIITYLCVYGGYL